MGKIDDLLKDSNHYVDDHGVIRQRESREYHSVSSVGPKVDWPDVVICRPMWIGPMQPYEERRYVPDKGKCKRIVCETTGVLVCSECGRGLSDKLRRYCYLHYCPHCGREIDYDGEQ